MRTSTCNVHGPGRGAYFRAAESDGRRPPRLRPVRPWRQRQRQRQRPGTRRGTAGRSYGPTGGSGARRAPRPSGAPLLPGRGVPLLGEHVLPPGPHQPHLAYGGDESGDQRAAVQPAGVHGESGDQAHELPAEAVGPPGDREHADGEGDGHADRRGDQVGGPDPDGGERADGEEEQPVDELGTVEQQPVETGEHEHGQAGEQPGPDPGQPGIGEPPQREHHGRHATHPDPVHGGTLTGRNIRRGRYGRGLRGLPALRGTCPGLLHPTNVGRRGAGKRALDTRFGGAWGCVRCHTAESSPSTAGSGGHPDRTPVRPADSPRSRPTAEALRGRPTAGAPRSTDHAREHREPGRYGRAPRPTHGSTTTHAPGAAPGDRGSPPAGRCTPPPVLDGRGVTARPPPRTALSRPAGVARKLENRSTPGPGKPSRNGRAGPGRP